MGVGPSLFAAYHARRRFGQAVTVRIVARPPDNGSKCRFDFVRFANYAQRERQKPFRLRASMTDSCFVTHLECSMTGERHDAGQLHNLSRAGKPLLVRYDLAAVARALSER